MNGFLADGRGVSPFLTLVLMQYCNRRIKKKAGFASCETGLFALYKEPPDEPPKPSLSTDEPPEEELSSWGGS